MSKHDDAILAALRRAAQMVVGEHTQDRTVAALCFALDLDDTIVPAMCRADALALHLEAQADAYKQAADRMNGALLTAMQESGAGSLRTEHHTLTLVETAGRPAVEDAALIPEHLKKPAAPRPCMSLIAAELKAGREVPGVRMSNGGAHLRRIARKTAP